MLPLPSLMATETRRGSSASPAVSDLVKNHGMDGLSAVRLALAGCVILSHSWTLGGFGAEPTLPGTTATLGTLAVAGFLALSGFLVTTSLLRTTCLRFLWHRCMRILPAYWAALFVVAGVIGLIGWLLTGAGATRYFAASPSPVGYVWNNWWLGQYQSGIGGIFNANPYGAAVGSPVNGSLWSLPYEFLCYLLLFAAGLCVLRSRYTRIVLGSILGLGAIACCALSVAFQAHTGLPIDDSTVTLPMLGPLSSQWICQLGLAFFLGGILALSAPRLRLTRTVILTFGLAGLVGVFVPTLHYVLFYPAMTVLLIGLGTAITGPIASALRCHDPSYGTYLYGFPIQQLLATANLSLLANPFLFATASFVLTVPFGLLSWYSIERPLSRLKDVAVPWEGRLSRSDRLSLPNQRESAASRRARR